MNERENKSAIENRQSKIGIDWQAIKERLARSQAALTAVEQLSPEEARALMDRRAELLAHVPERAPDTSEVLEVMTFRLGDERVAIETRFIHEVTLPSDVTPLPGGPDFLLGLTNLRGEVTAVIDLRQFLGITTAVPSENPQVLVLGDEHIQFGIVADAVNEVQVLRIDEILDPPGSIAGVSAECLRGVTSDALMVLDGQVLIQDERLYVDC